jgi:alpha-amylase
MSLWRFFGLASLVSSAIAATPAQWRTRSIYFMLTDRFAQTDGSTTATCDTNNGVCLF